MSDLYLRPRQEYKKWKESELGQKLFELLKSEKVRLEDALIRIKIEDTKSIAEYNFYQGRLSFIVELLEDRVLNDYLIQVELENWKNERKHIS